MSPSSVLVFGGTRGLGRAVADAFSAAGWRVGIVARGSPTLPCDVADQAAVEAAFARFGEAEVVVHAAAIQGGAGAIGPLWETEPAAFARVVDVNLTGAYHVLRAALRREARVVILFAGGGAAHARPRFAAYAASKAALVRLVETAAVELRAAGRAAHVFAVAPGPVHTAMTEEVLTLGERAGAAELAAAQAVARGGGILPVKAAELCLWLTTEAAAGLSGRLIHAAEGYRGLSPQPADAGCLRRVPFAGG